MAASNLPIVGCTFASDDAAIAAAMSLQSSGSPTTWRVGATDSGRAEKIAIAIGASGTLDPMDPLAGVAGLASGSDAAAGVNGGAVVGGVAGAVAGFFIGESSIGYIMPVDPGLRAAASTLLFFAIGVAVGGVLGGAFGRRPSTHAGFRLIDAMDAGDVALVTSIDRARVDDVRHTLETAGASEVVIIDAPGQAKPATSD